MWRTAMKSLSLNEVSNLNFLIYIYINREEGAIYLLTESATCFNTSWSCCCDSFSTCVFCFPFLCFSLSSFSIVAQFSPRRPLITLMMSSVPINPSSSKSALKKNVCLWYHMHALRGIDGLCHFQKVSVSLSKRGLYKIVYLTRNNLTLRLRHKYFS